MFPRAHRKFATDTDSECGDLSSRDLVRARIDLLLRLTRLLLCCLKVLRKALCTVEHVDRYSASEGRIGMSLDEVPPPGAALVEELDKRLLVQLRDGRKIVGILRWESDQIIRIDVVEAKHADCSIFCTSGLQWPSGICGSRLRSYRC